MTKHNHQLGFETGGIRDFGGAGVSVDEDEVCIDAADYAGTWEHPGNQASHCFKGEDRKRFLQFCADVAAEFPISPDDEKDEE